LFLLSAANPREIRPSQPVRRSSRGRSAAKHTAEMAHPSPVRVPLSRHERVVQSHRPEFLRRIGEPDILAAIKEATGKPVATEKLKVKSKQLLRTGLFKTCKARCSPIGCKRTVKACNQRFSHRPAAFTN